MPYDCTRATNGVRRWHTIWRVNSDSNMLVAVTHTHIAHSHTRTYAITRHIVFDSNLARWWSQAAVVSLHVTCGSIPTTTANCKHKIVSSANVLQIHCVKTKSDSKPIFFAVARKFFASLFSFVFLLTFFIFNWTLCGFITSSSTVVSFISAYFSYRYIRFSACQTVWFIAHIHWYNGDGLYYYV